MPRTAANRPYGLLANYYDQLFTFHLSWYETARERVLGRILPHVESACDLACGTGTTALMLARKGIKIPTIIITAHDEAGMRWRGSGRNRLLVKADSGYITVCCN